MKILHPISKVNVNSCVYTHIDKPVNDGMVSSTKKYKIWQCSWGEGNNPFLLITGPLTQINLGKNELCIEEMTHEEVITLFNKYKFPDGTFLSILRKISGEKSENKTIKDIIKTIMFYTRGNPLTPEFIGDLDKQKAADIINICLKENCEKDERLLFWAKTRLPIVSNDPKDYFIERYRGHSLIIKNPKCGFSTLATKVGESYVHISEASIRGFADCKGNIKYGIYNQKFGSITIDEASRYKEAISEMAMTFMEQGKDSISTGAINFDNIGAPSLSFVLNTGRDVSTESGMVEAIDSILPKLTSTPDAFGSRFGLIIIAGNLKQVKKGYLPREDIEENRIIVKSLFEMSVNSVKRIYRNRKVQEWLNQKIEGYEETILELTKGLANQWFTDRCKIFWEDHAKGAQQHVRGIALEYSIATAIADIIKLDSVDDKSIETILDLAEDALEIVKQININSLKTMVSVTEESEKIFGDTRITAFKALRELYLKGIVLAYCLRLKQLEQKPEHVLIDELYTVFNSITESKRREFESYINFGRVFEAFKKLSDSGKEEAKRSLFLKFGIELSFSEKHSTWIIKSKPNLKSLCDYIKSLVTSVESVEEAVKKETDIVDDKKKSQNTTPSNGSSNSIQSTNLAEMFKKYDS